MHPQPCDLFLTPAGCSNSCSNDEQLSAIESAPGTPWLRAAPNPRITQPHMSARHAQINECTCPDCDHRMHSDSRRHMRARSQSGQCSMRTLQNQVCHVVPPEKQHPDMFRGADRPFVKVCTAAFRFRSLWLVDPAACCFVFVRFLGSGVRFRSGRKSAHRNRFRSDLRSLSTRMRKSVGSWRL